MEENLTHVTEVITATASTLIAGGVFWLARRVSAMFGTLREVQQFISEFRMDGRINTADHDLLFKILKVPASDITEARRIAGINGGIRP